MFVSFLESFKYSGHLLPLVFLRVYMGYYYLNQAIIKYTGDYLFRPVLPGEISEWLKYSHTPIGYKAFIETYVIPPPYWQVFAYGITFLEFMIAFSYLFGFMVRPIGLAAAFVAFNFALLSGPESETLFKTFFAIHLTMAWFGGGRCLGFDYYFFKRQRGLWW
jgi:thiosulfate dehydrogenase [quinone] large subunit